MSKRHDRHRKRAMYLQKVRGWRRTRTRRSEPPSETAKSEKRKLLYAATHPLSIWPTTSIPEPYDGVIGVDIPAAFSFIEAPARTLEVLYRLRTALESPKANEIYINHHDCKLLDLCASVVADVLVLRGRKQRKVRGQSVRISGTFSTEPQVNVLLKASGILKHLGLAAATLPQDVRDRLQLCPLRIGSASPPVRTSDSEIAATELTRFFDNCLSTEEYRLKEEWQSNLISLATEVLDNCEQHARTDRYWHTIGHFNRLEGEAGGECHIVIFNFGDSIYESLIRPETSHKLQDRIRALASLHRTKGFFGLGRKSKWDEESLWTLYALQEGVSRFTGTPGGEDRGNGTVRMIEFFTRVAGENPKMAVISGSTYILFDGTRKMKDAVLEGGETRKIIGFNDDNDLTQPPDEHYVKTLPYKFPGTLVSLRFVLHKQWLKDVREVVHAEANSD